MKQEIKLSEFLKEQGAYEKFVKNSDIVYFNNENFDGKVTLLNAFDWQDSKEGYHYWCKIYDKWYELVTNIKVYDMDFLLEKGREKYIEIDKELFSKCWDIPLDIISDLKCNIEWDEISYYDLEDEAYTQIGLSEFVLHCKTFVTDMFISSGNTYKNGDNSMDKFTCAFEDFEKECEECNAPSPINYFFAETEQEAILKGMTWYINKDKK